MRVYMSVLMYGVLVSELCQQLDQSGQMRRVQGGQMRRVHNRKVTVIKKHTLLSTQLKRLQVSGRSKVMKYYEGINSNLVEV